MARNVLIKKIKIWAVEKIIPLDFTDIACMVDIKLFLYGLNLLWFESTG